MVFKKSKKDALELTATTAVLGTGATIGASLGGNTAGLQSFSSGLGPAGSILGASISLKSLKGLEKAKKRR